MSSLTRLTAAVSVIAGCAISAVACEGASSVASFGGGPGTEDGGLTPYRPDASDAGAPETGVDVQLALATPLIGNPACQASAATCSPDSFSVCGPTAWGTPVEAGVADGYGGYAAVLGCHVAPTAMMAAPDATNTAALTTPAVAPACLPAGLGLDGVFCDAPSDCAPGYECVSPVGVVGVVQKTCRHYCCGGNTPPCLHSQFCDIQQTTQTPPFSVPVCMPVESCQLLTNTCHPGYTCAVVREDGTKSCVAVGNATEGQSCDTQHCASDLVCLGTPGARTCYRLCAMKASNACQTPQTCKGGPPLFVDPGVGICE